MEIGPCFPGSDDVIASGKITIARARKLKRNVKCKSSYLKKQSQKTIEIITDKIVKDPKVM